MDGQWTAFEDIAVSQHIWCLQSKYKHKADERKEAVELNCGLQAFSCRDSNKCIKYETGDPTVNPITAWVAWVYLPSFCPHLTSITSSQHCLLQYDQIALPWNLPLVKSILAQFPRMWAGLESSFLLHNKKGYTGASFFTSNGLVQWSSTFFRLHS